MIILIIPVTSWHVFYEPYITLCILFIELSEQQYVNIIMAIYIHICTQIIHNKIIMRQGEHRNDVNHVRIIVPFCRLLNSFGMLLELF